MSKQISILSGPSREELFDGLRLFTEKRPVSFTISQNGIEQKVLVVMQGLTAEDGSGNNWNIKIVVAAPILEGLVAKMPYPIDPTNELHCKSVRLTVVEGFYSTHTRKGHVQIK